MKKITIFQPSKGEEPLTETDSQILYDRIRDNSKLHFHHTDAFMSMDEIAAENRPVRSNIPALLLKNIIDNVQPIVSKKSSSKYHVSIQLNKPITTLQPDLEKYGVVARDSLMRVVGINFDNGRNFYNNMYKPTQLESADASVLTSIGNYGEYTCGSALRKCSLFQHRSQFGLNSQSMVIMFPNKEKAIDAFRLVETYMAYMRGYYAESVVFMHKALWQSYGVLDKYRERVRLQNPVKNTTKTSPTLARIEELYTGKLISHNNRVVLMYDIMAGGLWDIYQHAKITGFESDMTMKLIEDELQSQTYHKNQYNRTVSTDALKTINTVRSSTAMSLFGESDVLKLSKKQLDVVELTLAKQHDMIKHASEQKCEHLKLLSRVMRSNRQGRRFDARGWEDLKKLIPQTSETELSRCTACSQLVICPHTYELLNNNLKRHNKDLRSGSEFRVSLIRKFSGSTPLQDAFFCKICGDQLAKQIAEGRNAYIQGKKVEVHRDENALSGKVWKNVKNIITTHINFNTLTDVGPIISTITENILPFVEDERDRVLQIKTNDTNDVSDIVYLFIAIYTFAAIVRVISHHPDDISFRKMYSTNPRPKTIKGGREVSTKHLQRLFMTALELVINTQQTLIQRIPHISKRTIKPLLINAYKKISKLFIVTEQFNTELPPEYVAVNTEYQYMYYIMKKTNKTLEFHDVKSVIGVDFDDVSKLEYILEKATVPKMWRLSGDAEADTYSKYAYASFIHFYRYSKNRVFNTDAFKNVVRANDRDAYLKLLNVERSIIKKIIDRSRIHETRYIHNRYGDYVYKPTSLSKVYCSTGQKHVFDIHVFKKPKDGAVEISVKDIGDWVTNEEKNKLFLKLKITGAKCSICGVYRENIRPSNDASIAETIATNNEKQSFYNMYTFGCPMGTIHSWIKDKCTKCKVTRSKIATRDDSYYNKYVPTFRKSIVDQSQEMPTVTLTEQQKSNKEPAVKWELNIDHITRLAGLANVAKNVLLNIGGIEGVNYREIVDGTINPSIADDTKNSSSRFIQVVSHMNSFMVHYEKLRNGSLTTGVVEKHPDINFSLFPDVYDGFNKKLSTYADSELTHEQLSNFVMSSLAKSLLSIVSFFDGDLPPSMNKKQYKPVAVEYITGVVKSIIKTDVRLSNPGILRGKYVDVDDDDSGDAVEDTSSVVTQEYDPFNLESTGMNVGGLQDNIGDIDD
jgi:hypothetical protein